METEAKLHRLIRFAAVVGLAAAGARAAAACNDTALVEPPNCHPAHCTCEEDPAQSVCRGFNDRPEASKPDASESDAGDEQ